MNLFIFFIFNYKFTLKNNLLKKKGLDPRFYLHKKCIPIKKNFILSHGHRSEPILDYYKDISSVTFWRQRTRQNQVISMDGSWLKGNALINQSIQRSARCCWCNRNRLSGITFTRGYAFPSFGSHILNFFFFILCFSSI